MGSSDRGRWAGCGRGSGSRVRPPPRPRAAARAPQRQPVPPIPHWGQRRRLRAMSRRGTPSPGGIPYLPLVLMLAALVGFIVTIDVQTSRRRGPRAGRQAPPSDAVVPSIGPVASPAPVPSREWADDNGNGGAGPRLGEVLRDAGALSVPDLVAALREQARSGGRLGEILTASGIVPVATLTAALGRQLGMDTLRSSDEPVALLTSDDAQTWRAVALRDRRTGTVRSPWRSRIRPTRSSRSCRRALGGRSTRDCATRRRSTSCSTAYTQTPTRRTSHGRCARRRRSCRLSAPGSRSRRPWRGSCSASSSSSGLLTDLLVTATVLVGLATAFFVDLDGVPVVGRPAGVPARRDDRSAPRRARGHG